MTDFRIVLESANNRGSWHFIGICLLSDFLEANQDMEPADLEQIASLPHSNAQCIQNQGAHGIFRYTRIDQ